MSETSSKAPTRAHHIELSTVILSLRDSCLIQLGLKEGAEAGAAPDFEGASYQIDLLDLLREKTEGNLSEDEGRMLALVLNELRIAFVECRERHR